MPSARRKRRTRLWRQSKDRRVRKAYPVLLVLPDLPDATAWTDAMAMTRPSPVLKANPDPKAHPDHPASVDLPDPVERVDLQAARPCW